MVNKFIWRNGEMVTLPQWGYGEMSKRNGIIFLPSTKTFPPVEKCTNWVRVRL